VNSLLDAKDSDRVYELADDENGAATLTFGSRLPTGQENVRASYRLGIGAEGNVKEGQISQLVSRPLGVQGVVNPIKSSGGADRDGPERIRRNLSLATKGLGPSARLVSVDDYASFALQFAGIGHAQAQKLAGGWVHVTVAGVDDIPLDEEGALLTNLKIAYRKFGDPALQVAMSVRELKALVIDAKVFVDPDAELSTVEANLRARLLDRFSFERSLLGKSIYLSDVVATMQEVSGVDWVDVDLFAGISENELLSDSESAPTVGKLKLESQVICVAATLSRDDPVRKKIWDSVIGKAPRFLPAQLAYFVPQVPRTIVLNISPSSGR
jgi:predicted phage baseplate assembly protein